MKTIKRILIVVLLLIIAGVAYLYLSGKGFIFKAVRITYGNGEKTAFLSDYKYFDNHVIKKGNYVEPWPDHKEYNQNQPPKSLEALNKKYETVAFIIIKNDSIWFEKYYDGYSDKSQSNSFSMAKSYVSAMLGKAIEQGYIKSLNQPVGDFIPEFLKGDAKKLTVGDLSSMASGLDWDEEYYSPFSVTTEAYFTDDVRALMKRLAIVDEPGQKYNYQSGSTQLLGMVLEKATGKTLSEYLSETIWQPTGSQYDALWQVDDEENGMEKAYCCIASNAKDFARLGKLYKDYGKWHGKQVLDSAFVVKSITPRFKEAPYYGYGMWMLDYRGKHFFMMRGHLGQYVMVEPKDNIMIVRLGNLRAPQSEKPFTEDIFEYIDEAYKMLDNAQ